MDQTEIKKRLLITGVSGLLGSNLAYFLRDKYNVLGLYHAHRVESDMFLTQGIDLRDRTAVCALVRKYSPDVIIHAAAMAYVDKCEEDPGLAQETNVQVTQNVIDAITNPATRFVYVSTDMVYDGIKGHFCEDDAAGPCNVYARTKLEGERAALLNTRALALRTNFFGWDVTSKRSLAEWVMRELGAGHPVKGFKDAIFSSIYTRDLAALMHAMLERQLTGVYNAACSSAMSKYDFLTRVASGVGLDPGKIEAVLLGDAGLRAVRGKDFSLDIHKLARDIDLKSPSVIESVDRFVADFKNGLPQELRTAVRAV
ncbi:MAG: SDR family oxidoreductase [Candidatus Omnitrophica bacterium]|nr:SDR family oxidoreductase [Candidatus Omnitrophota bacterium]